ncbi:MAG: efflux transporter periplasmic adaptor subunit, partial [Methylococcales bacterium]|nr:efflux transporter periplasmic adaptor subunit [Methylococcales bacterium]
MKTGLSKLSKSYHWVIEPILVIAVLLFGFISAKSLSSSKETPISGKTEVVYAPLVKTIHTHNEDTHLLIRGHGTLQARTRIRIVPQVGGRITFIHPQLRAGGQFQANETLLTIEALDYELAIISAEADVAAAQRMLDIEQAEAEAAQQEWFALNPDEAVPMLVGRTPQIAEAQAHSKAAQARLRLAQLNLKRTRIQMPFAGRVVESRIDI